MRSNRLVVWITAVVVASLAGALAALAAIRLTQVLIGEGVLVLEGPASLTIIGYVVWAVVALSVSALWIRGQRGQP